MKKKRTIKKRGRGIESDKYKKHGIKLTKKAKEILSNKRKREKYDEKKFLVLKAINRFEKKNKKTIPKELRIKMGLYDLYNSNSSKLLSINKEIELKNFLETYVTNSSALKLINNYLLYFKEGIFIDNIKKYKTIDIKNKPKFIKNRFSNITNEVNTFFKNLLKPYEQNKRFFNKLIEEMESFPTLSKLQYNTEGSSNYANTRGELILTKSDFLSNDLYEILNIENNKLLKDKPWYFYYGLLCSIIQNIIDRPYVENIIIKNQIKEMFNLSTNKDIKDKIEELENVVVELEEAFHTIESIMEKKIYHLYDYDEI